MIKFGNENNYWLQLDDRMDISRGARQTVTCNTTTLPLTFDPRRSALTIIDMQNFFLAERLGRGETGRNLVPSICDSVKYARRIGMKIVWVNWGVRPDLVNMPPGILRTFQRSGSIDPVWQAPSR